MLTNHLIYFFQLRSGPVLTLKVLKYLSLELMLTEVFVDRNVPSLLLCGLETIM